MKLRVIKAAEELHDVEIEKRECKFEDEGSELKIFRYLLPKFLFELIFSLLN